MIEVVGCIVDGHELWLVVVAGLICLLASHSAFSLLSRAVHQDGHQRFAWLVAAAVAMGSGVWATHFVAMLAYHTPWPVGYDIPLTALSALIAMAVSGVGLYLALSDHRALGGAIAGTAIGAMHFTGMAALEGSFNIEWDMSYVAASVAVGIVLSTVAFCLLPRAGTLAGRLLVVNVFVLAICALHFTAMTAVTISFDPLSNPAGATALERQSLAIAVAAVAALLLGAGLTSAFIDDYLADRHAREAERLRRYVSELEATQAELQATTENLSRALAAAAASSQAKSQFLATMSHELRTPLNAIIGFSELMKSEALGPIGNPSYAEYAGDIHDSGNHLLILINEVLDFSKIEAGHLELNEEPVDAAQLLAECVRLIAPQAREAKLELETDLPAEPMTLLIDHRRVKQIALNLLSNAVKFTPSGGTVSVALSLDADGAAMVIGDTGIGMKPEQIPVALEAFGQIDSRLSRKYEGTGLGLPLCRRLAEAHDGRIEIDSQPGQGTTVTVRFPHERLVLSAAA